MGLDSVTPVRQVFLHYSRFVKGRSVLSSKQSENQQTSDCHEPRQTELREVHMRPEH